MKKSKEHVMYKLIGTSIRNNRVICYVLHKHTTFYLEHIEHSPSFLSVRNLELRTYLCSMEEDILKGEFDDNLKSESLTNVRIAVELL